MLISLLLIAVATAGGAPLTYLFDDESPFLWRVAAGSIIGCAILGTVGFLLALFFGLTVVTVIIAVAISLLPLLLVRGRTKSTLSHDWSKAKGRLQGANTRRFLRFGYYAFFFILFFLFFDRAMLESTAGIFTGGSQNLGDLPFHLGAIFSFTEANNFPPENPSFAGARFSYPFIADLLTAFAVKLGANVRDAMFFQNIWWAMSLTIILERFVLVLTHNRLAARLAPVLLFLSGGLGFVWAFGDYWSQGKSFFDFFAHLPKDYTIGSDFRWGNSMVVLFMTQRSLLLGMPLTLVVLGYLWRRFASEENDRHSYAALFVGLIAGLLPLIHLHSLAVLFVVGMALLILKPQLWKIWLLFAVGVAIVSVPELLWSVSGSASETTKFFAWHFGWDKGEKNFVWFWLINTGILIPAILAGMYISWLPRTHDDTLEVHKKSKHKHTTVAPEPPPAVHHSQLILFYIPFAFLFLVSNVAKLAPWEWDNIKVLIYWFVGSLPFVALVIAWLWEQKTAVFRSAAALCVIVLIASGSLDVWRTISAQTNYKVFDKDAVEVAHQVKLRTPADALFLNAPTYNTAVVLTGRQSLMRYPGHLGSHGINYSDREADVKRMYAGGPDARSLMEKYGIDYVVVSPEERAAGTVNDQFFGAFPVTAEAGQYRVYKVR